MFKRMKLNNEIKKCRKEIEMLEQKRNRSQAALVAAILNNTTPSDSDVDYFNRYTKKIDEARDKMMKLQDELAAL